MKYIARIITCLDGNRTWITSLYPVKNVEHAEDEFKEIVNDYKNDPPEGTVILSENSISDHQMSFTVYDNHLVDHKHIRSFQLINIEGID